MSEQVNEGEGEEEDISEEADSSNMTTNSDGTLSLSDLGQVALQSLWGPAPQLPMEQAIAKPDQHEPTEADFEEDNDTHMAAQEGNGPADEETGPDAVDQGSGAVEHGCASGSYTVVDQRSELELQFVIMHPLDCAHVIAEANQRRHGQPNPAGLPILTQSSPLISHPPPF
jgi:hypothetical protein